MHLHASSICRQPNQRCSLDPTMAQPCGIRSPDLALKCGRWLQNKGLGPEAQIVTACPEVRTQQLQPGDEFLLLACDGIWDVLTNQEVGPRSFRGLCSCAEAASGPGRAVQPWGFWC